MFKSFISLLPETELLVKQKKKIQADKLLPYYELYKLVKHLEGSILKCGITTDEAFGYFSLFKKINTGAKQPLIAFEKNPSVFIQNEADTITVKDVKQIGEDQLSLIKKGVEEKIEFIPGQLAESIPQYLIQNPELKIILLTIDLDDFESTLTAMQYLYPRLVQGGILIINNFYKKKEESLAIREYFATKSVVIRHFSLEKGPHYIVKDY